MTEQPQCARRMCLDHAEPGGIYCKHHPDGVPIASPNNYLGSKPDYKLIAEDRIREQGT